MGGDLKRPQGKLHGPVPRASGSSPAKAKPHMRETRPKLRGGPPPCHDPEHLDKQAASHPAKRRSLPAPGIAPLCKGSQAVYLRDPSQPVSGRARGILNAGLSIPGSSTHPHTTQLASWFPISFLKSPSPFWQFPPTGPAQPWNLPGPKACKKQADPHPPPSHRLKNFIPSSYPRASSVNCTYSDIPLGTIRGYWAPRVPVKMQIPTRVGEGPLRPWG